MINVENANLLQIAAYLETGEPSGPALEKRLRELHDLTRWIPVSERMPTEEDGKWVQARVGEHIPCMTPVEDFTRFNDAFTHWKRITTPEDKP